MGFFGWGCLEKLSVSMKVYEIRFFFLTQAQWKPQIKFLNSKKESNKLQSSELNETRVRLSMYRCPCHSACGQ